MVKRNVIVPKLDYLEALGAVTNNCSNKTGTLTQGKMVVKKVWIPSKGIYSMGVSNEPFNPTVSDVTFTPVPPTHFDQEKEGAPIDSLENSVAGNPRLEEFLNVAAMANLSHVYRSEQGEWHVHGEATEIAIQVFASQFNLNRDQWTKDEGAIWHQKAEFQFHSSVKKMSVVFTRLEGQTECSMVFTKGAVERIVDACTSVLWEQDKALEGANLQCNEVERDLCFLGLIGLYDLLCPETAGAICACYQAGIAVHMVMGDHPGTAKAIAQQVGMVLANLSTAAADVADVMVMTAACGCWDRDRPGRFDVAKDASDIILTDDNLASILEVVKEGRCIFDNNEKFMLYLLSKNIAQSVFLLAPVEILWIIIITSGMPDIGLGMEIATLEIMDRPPQIKQGIFTREVIINIVVYGISLAAVTTSTRQTATWPSLCLNSQRYLTQWMFDIWRNQFLFWSIVAGSMTTFPIIYIPVLNHVVFKHTGISWEWGIVFVEAVLFFLGVELWKFSKRVYFRQRKESPATGNEWA
ncbi:sodium transporting ATPase, putative [Aspergillus fumigatus A1163]|uniref:Sodium transporting ATPase, putative n=1 Tax=Aspergillus fumigatus (strain CBS 144.89 / FGSC A1163 / CEA10) TaxID=451804 RepID=B0YEV3_ASPFC|nr:sodium transporting ATPase, putative [Aspergillus fumigatus A1163]